MCWSLDAADHTAARAARKAATAALRAFSRDEDALAAAELVIGELLANVSRHASGQICLELSASEGLAQVSVHDTAPNFAFDIRRPVDQFSESGRGMLIISELARRIDIVPLAGVGKRVTVTLDFPLPASGAFERPCDRERSHEQNGVCLRPEGKHNPASV
jgi:anti-sigma regulatory factor (Ser/Thr protein kinase)